MIFGAHFRALDWELTSGAKKIVNRYDDKSPKEALGMFRSSGCLKIKVGAAEEGGADIQANYNNGGYTPPMLAAC